MTTRQRRILITVVEHYIATGEPVGSGAIAQRAFANSMSSATVRNEMAELADAGLLEQPHTSAGRVPSAEAFRLYVGQLRQDAADMESAGQRVAPSDLQQRIDSSFAGVAGSPALLERTSHVLATLSSGVGLAMGAAASSDILEHVHFSRLATARVLAVVVTRAGVVRDRVLALDRDLTTLELETAARFLNEHFRGWNIDRVRTELARRLERERSAYQQLVDATALWLQALPSVDAAQAVYVEGVANLLGMPQIAEDRLRLQAMLAALEARQRIVELLNAYVDAQQTAVQVVFDLEEQDPGMAGLVLIAAPAHMSSAAYGAASASGERLGTVAILGPKRMDYRSAMDAVSYVTQLLHRREAGGWLAATP